MSTEPGPPSEGEEISPEEIIAAMVQRMAETPVPDILMQTMATFTDVSAIRLGLGPGGEDHRDLPQALLALECLRALLGVAEAALGPQAAAPFREPLSALQLTYARLVEERSAPPPPGPEAGPEAGGIWTPPGTTGPEAGRGRLWTPGSDR